MKKTLLMISMLAVTMGFTACSSDDDANEQPVAGKMTIEVGIDNNFQKTALSGNDEDGYNVVWSEDDVITIGGKTFTLVSGAGTTRATFTGDAPADGTYTAKYGGSITSQNYVAGKISNSPMTSQEFEVTGGKVNGLIKFKNDCGLLRLSLTGEDALKPETDVKITSIKVNTGGSNNYTLNCGDGVTLAKTTPTAFDIAIPAGDYEEVSIFITNADGNVCVKELKSGNTLDIVRSQITKAGFAANFGYITYKSPTGTIGMLDGRQGLVCDLGGTIGKIVMATCNVGANAPEEVGTYMNFNEATTTNFGTGWSVIDKQTTITLVQIVTPDKPIPATTLWYWIVDKDKDIRLIGPVGGYKTSSDGPVIGKEYALTAYWTSEANGTDNAWCTFTDLDALMSEPKAWYMLVRLCHEMPKAPVSIE